MELPEDMEIESCSKRMLKKDDAVFREYIENTTTHGVVRIFSDKSLFRRLFWLLIVLGASVGCLYNCIDRIRFLVSEPTSTTISIRREHPINFPAVTFCNLNFLTIDGLNSSGILPLAADVLNLEPEFLGDGGLCSSKLSADPSLSGILMEELIKEASNDMDELLSNCTFAGKPCRKEDFEPIVTTFGLCYTFNAGLKAPIMQTNGTGIRLGLSIFLNVEQYQYVSSPSLDAGVRVVIHPQSEPPLPLNQGIAIPPGRTAFIGLSQRMVVDETGRQCRSESDMSGFNYLQEEYQYSASSCSLDCFHTQLAKKCGCSYSPMQYPPDTPVVADLRPCNFQDICCVQDQAVNPEPCECISACKTRIYDAVTSYSTFPAQYILDVLDAYFNLPYEIVRENFVVVNVYFETANIEHFTTTSAYSVVALLSDIGGQLGLFLGVSVVSMMEFGVWLLDEFRDRCLCSLCKQKKRKNKISKNLELEADCSV